MQKLVVHVVDGPLQAGGMGERRHRAPILRRIDRRLQVLDQRGRAAVTAAAIILVGYCSCIISFPALSQFPIALRMSTQLILLCYNGVYIPSTASLFTLTKTKRLYLIYGRTR